MFNVLYAIWSLLPLGLILLGLWALAKPHLGVRGKEAAKPYFVQGLFCAFALGIAIFIDGSEWFATTIEAYSFSWFNLSIARWLLYPGILLALAYIQKYWYREDKDRVSPRKFIMN